MPTSLGEVRAAIVDLVVGDENHAARAAARLTQIGGWDAALPQAARWGVIALLHARLNVATAPPAGVLATLRAESLRGVLRSRARRRARAGAAPGSGIPGGHPAVRSAHVRHRAQLPAPQRGAHVAEEQL